MSNEKNANLNLARKLRPQNFDTIIGQEICVRMLKNSLYLKKYFPVYLFSGQRGCGKTSTARVFATAINCEQLEVFQQDPTKQAIPCLSCTSCLSMLKGQHPDFIEIDAASHTGVDNVRSIIEAASYIPLAGKKKVYLIDEVHMLSKAAFNAFLKILEEPAETVLFILATTEHQKIPETVLSRCFQLIFRPINQETLKDYLSEICKKEKIAIEGAALDTLIDETDGSARDALNLLEQVRFSSEQVSNKHILSILGKVSHGDLIALFKHIIAQKPHELLEHLSAINLEKTAPQAIWDMIIQLCRSLLWLKYNVTKLPNIYINYIKELSELARQCSLNRLHAIMQLLWDQEMIFTRTDKKHIFLELLFLQICEQTPTSDIKEIINNNFGHLQDFTEIKKTAPIQKKILNRKAQENNITGKETSPFNDVEYSSEEVYQPVINVLHRPTDDNEAQETKKTVILPVDSPWQKFILVINERSEDQLLKAILFQAAYLNSENEHITISLTSNSSFFKDKLEETKSFWLPLLQQQFPTFKQFIFATAQAAKPKPIGTKQQKEFEETIDEVRDSSPTSPFNHSDNQKGSNAIDIKNKDKWPLTNLIISHFPGKIRKVSA